MADTMRKNTNDRTRGGVAHSSDEAFVMKVERRGSVILLGHIANLLKRG